MSFSFQLQVLHEIDDSNQSMRFSFTKLFSLNSLNNLALE